MGLVSLFVRWISYIILFFFFLICLASGLFYIAELIEEHTMITKKWIRYTIIVKN